MSQTNTIEIADYTQWQAKDYLTEYYGEVMPDERFAMKFIVESMRRLPAVPVALEFGCGPTIHHSLPMVNIASEIHMAEYLANNRTEVEKWLRADADAFDWHDFVVETLQLEGVAAPTDSQIQEREQALRDRVSQVLPGNAFDTDQLGADRREFYPIVA